MLKGYKKKINRLKERKKQILKPKPNALNNLKPQINMDRKDVKV